MTVSDSHRTMIKLHPEVLKKNGVNEFVILPYDEFVALQKLLADAQDLTDLREAVRVEGGAPTISLEELKTELGCRRQGVRWPTPTKVASTRKLSVSTASTASRQMTQTKNPCRLPIAPPISLTIPSET